MKKRIIKITMAAAAALGLTFTSFAGEWHLTPQGWWWENDNGSYPANTWQWIDGNRDGIAECYYFGKDGFMLEDTTTPDHYKVDANGAWVVNQVVQTRRSGVSQSTSTSEQASGDKISVEAAKKAALSHAGLKESQVLFVKQELDWDDGQLIYDIEFYTSDYKEYDYEINAYTGAVIDFDYDAEDYTPSTAHSKHTSGSSQSKASGADSYIGEEKAKTAALSNAGFTASQVSNLRCYLEHDDGRWEYNVEFYQGTMEYEYEIDAYSGTILSRDIDSIYD